MQSFYQYVHYLSETLQTVVWMAVSLHPWLLVQPVKPNML